MTEIERILADRDRQLARFPMIRDRILYYARRTDGTVVTVVTRSDDSQGNLQRFLVRTTSPNGVERQQEITKGQLLALGFGRELEAS